MTSRPMLYAVAAAALMVSPAAAQAPDAVGACDLAAIAAERFAALDADGDASLSREEVCPTAAAVPAAKRAFDDAFVDADADEDGALSLVEVEAYAAPDVAATGEPQAPRIVGEAGPGADAPGCSAPLAEPELGPQADGAQPAPEDAGESMPPTGVEGAAPPSAGEAIPPGEATSSAAASPAEATPADETAAQRGGGGTDAPIAPTAEAAAAQPGQAPDTAAAPPAADPTAGATASAPMPATFQINVKDLDGADVINTAGDEIGKIADVLLDPRTDSPVVIISVGGLLGIGDREIPFPYSDFLITGEDVVLNTALSAEQIEDMPEYDEGQYEPLPDTMRVP